MRNFLITLISLFIVVGSVGAIEFTVQELEELIGQNDEVFGSTWYGMVDNENYNVGVRIFNNGGKYVRLLSTSTVSSDIDFYLPAIDGTNGQVLKTDGNGSWSFGTAGTPSLTLGNVFVGDSSNEAVATSTIFITNEKVGIGTTTPIRTLDVFGTFGVSGATTFNTVAYTWPASDGTLNYSLTTDGAGQLSWADVSKASTSDTVVFNVTANEAITKGQAVYVSGELGGLSLVNLADADDSSKMPSLGLAATTVASGSALQIIQTGKLTGFDTSSYTAGDAIYVATTSGALVNYRPSASNEFVQKMAQVENSDASGNIVIFGAGRSNDVPNIFTVNRATSTDFTVTGNLKAGTVISGTWNGTAISDTYVENDLTVNLQSGSKLATSSALYTNTSGEFGVDTTSGQFRYNDGTATRTLVYFDYFKGTLFASSTDAAGTGPNATSTFELPRLFEAFTITDIYCETDTGTSSLRVGDGSNWSEILFCDSDGTEDDGSIANGTFTAKETIQVEYLNNYTGNPLQTALTIKYNYDAD